jgi:hypothetical protein
MRTPLCDHRCRGAALVRTGVIVPSTVPTRSATCPGPFRLRGPQEVLGYLVDEKALVAAAEARGVSTNLVRPASGRLPQR